ncbi:DUF4254 domain-containing protein [Nocardia sp. GCM10030253]|uniref:DUF4254 domain-containing protein n=1 Tax=Nocardia sp. GCM10030253 TaxID=3273404 RepID=UPI0036274E95
MRTTCVRATLPALSELVAAFRGRCGHTPGDHLILRWAQSLAHLHRVRLINPARASEIDHRREEVAVLIDSWVALHIPAPPHPCESTERIGTAVDQMAEAHVAAEIALETEHTPDELHAAWEHVGYLGTRWTDLVSAVIDGQSPLPPKN